MGAWKTNLVLNDGRVSYNSFSDWIMGPGSGQLDVLVNSLNTSKIWFWTQFSVLREPAILIQLILHGWTLRGGELAFLESGHLIVRTASRWDQSDQCRKERVKQQVGLEKFSAGRGEGGAEFCTAIQGVEEALLDLSPRVLAQFHFDGYLNFPFRHRV